MDRSCALGDCAQGHRHAELSWSPEGGHLAWLREAVHFDIMRGRARGAAILVQRHSSRSRPTPRRSRPPGRARRGQRHRSGGGCRDLLLPSACRLDTGCDVIRGMPTATLRKFASSIQTVAGRVDNAHVGVPDASVTHVGTADDRRAARSRLGPSTGGRGEQAQPGCLNYAVAAKRGLCGDVGVPTRQASSAALTLSGACSAERAR